MTQIIGFDPDGVSLANTSGKASLYGKTPIVQQTAPTIVTYAIPAGNTSTLVASIHSLAVYAVSTVNTVVQDLIDIGVYA